MGTTAFGSVSVLDAKWNIVLEVCSINKLINLYIVQLYKAVIQNNELFKFIVRNISAKLVY